MTVLRGNLFAPADTAMGGETIEKILATPNVTIERIVSLDHATPPDEWYDQDDAEWVVVLSGAAGLLFDGEAQPMSLVPGDHVHIAPHRRHRIAWTAKDEPTIWLAVHYRP